MITLEQLLQGETTTVSNLKGEGNIEDKIVSITKVSIPRGTKAKVVQDFDLKMIIKDKEVKFALSQEFFDSVTGLDTKGTGFTHIFVNDSVFLHLCSEGVENPFNNKPLYLNNLKGAKKALTFKSQALEFYIKKIKTIDLYVNTEHLFKCVQSNPELPEIYEIKEGSDIVEFETEINNEASVETPKEYVDPAQINLLDVIEEVKSEQIQPELMINEEEIVEETKEEEVTGAEILTFL